MFDSYNNIDVICQFNPAKERRQEMKSSACLLILLLIAIPCAALSDELVLDKHVLKIAADNPGATRYIFLYTLKISSSDGGFVSTPGEGSFQYDPGTVETVTATAEQNYHFVNWTGTAVNRGNVTDPEAASTTITVNANDTLVANFAINQRTLTIYSSDGGSVSTPGEGSFQYDPGTVETVTATAEQNYHFVSWTGTAVNAGSVADPESASTTVTMDLNYTLEANFAIDQHTLVTSSSDGGSVFVPGEGSFQYDYGAVETVTATAEQNYHFVNWTGTAVDAGNVANPDSASTTVTMKADYTLIANFEIDQHTLTTSSSEGGSVSLPGEGSFQYDHGVSVEVTADPNFGYVVDKWYLDGNEVQSGGAIYVIDSMQTDYVLNVIFKLIQYTITPTADPWHGSIHPYDTVTVNHGQSVQFIANASTGYQVDTWYLDGNDVQDGGDIYLLTDIQADHTVHVTFKQYLYKIVSTSDPNGSVSPEIIYVEPGGKQIFTAHPDLGYSVDRWIVDGFTVQIFGDTYTLKDIQEDHIIHVTFRKSLAYSLDSIDFDNEQEFETRVVTNNIVDPNLPESNRIYVERLVGNELDPNGVMLMRNLTDLDPTSPNYGKTIRARAKGLFIKTSSDEIMIRFKYMFYSSMPGVGLIIYLSDSVELLDPNDPNRPEHYLEVARLAAPPFPRPGSAGSGRFGVFEKIVWTGHLNFSEEICVELELVGPENNGLLFATGKALRATSAGSTSAVIDSLSPAVQCYGICLDINWDNFVDEADFMMVVGECGGSAVGDVACMDGVFSADGYMDTYDVASWDWALHSDDHLLNYCKIPLVRDGVTMMSAAVRSLKLKAPLVLADLPDDLSDLLIIGKSGESNVHSKLRDRFYLFDQDGISHGWLDDTLERCNIRLVQGPGGEVYFLNSENGLLRLDGTNDAVVPPGKIALTNINEPRYNRPATVYVGIQDEGSNTYGRPILDAALDVNYIYVVPVVVDPEGGEPYTAAAKLRLLDGGNPPYEIVQLYDESPLLNDNQYRNYLREIELDSTGNLYVLNVHCLNESDILWRYDPNGIMERLDLGRPDINSYLPAPIGMYVSKSTDKLYLTSSESNLDNPDSTVLYVFSTQGVLTLEQTITIDGMQHVTGITEDPATRSLWVVGFNMINIPQYPNPYQPAFYYPYMAKLSNGGDDVQLISLYDPGLHDLALPMSIIWTGTADNGLD
jgi:hypothetical protein